MLDLDRTAWERVKFGDVVKNANAKSTDLATDGIDRVIAMEHLDPGELAIRRWGPFEAGTTFTRRVTPGQTLFGKRRAYQRKVAYAEFDAICSGDILTFEAIPEKLLAELLPFIVQSDPFFERAVGTSAGSLSPRTNWRDLAKFEFDLPPLDEQKRIADLLWAVERHRRELVSLSTQMKLCRRDEVDRQIDVAVSARAVPLSDVAEVRGGISKGKAIRGEAVELPYLRVANVKDGELDLTEVKAITVSVSDAERFRLEPGDVLMTEGGDIDKLGRGTVWRGEIPDCLHQNHVFAVRVDHSKVRPYWISIHSESTHGRGYFLTAGKKTSNLASVNKTQVSAFPIGVTSLAEQDESLARVSHYDRAIDLIDREFATAEVTHAVLLSSIFGDS